MGIQFTLALLKPDLFGNPKNLKLVQESIINTHRLSILDYKVIRWTSLEARSFYAEHDGRTFQNRLVTYMSRCVPVHRFPLVYHGTSLFITIPPSFIIVNAHH